MKHLKTYRIFEGIKNPIADYIVHLEDLGFKTELDDSKPGHLDLDLESKDLSDDLIIQIMNEYLTLIERLKDEWVITKHSIKFLDNNYVSISIDRKIKDVSQEFEMSQAQKLAYDLISSTLKPDQYLKIDRVSDSLIEFNKADSVSYSSFISIYSDGRISLPILRGMKSQRLTELPFTNDDVNWFNRILWVDRNYKKSTEDEFDILHRKSQEELREIYK